MYVCMYTCMHVCMCEYHSAIPLASRLQPLFVLWICQLILFSGPLRLLILLPGMLIPQVSAWLPPHHSGPPDHAS